METKIENGKIINKKVPEVIEFSNQYKKEMKKLLRLNNIFSEFENKATKELNFFIDESNKRYSMSKFGNNIKALITSTRKKSLDESKKILNDNFYNNKIIESEKEKMKHKGNKILYQKLRNYMEIVKNPGLMKNQQNNTDKNILLKRKNNNKESKKYNFNFNITNLDKNEKTMDSIINEEQKSLSKSIDNYKSNLDNLRNILNNIPVINKRKHSFAYKKLNLNLPKLKFINYSNKKVVKKLNDRDDPNKKADIHKLLPFSNLSKKIADNSITPQSTLNIDSRKSRALPYITEPKSPNNKQIPNNFQNYKDYQSTIDVVATSANKELFAIKNFDKKRNEVENILMVDDIPKIQLYDDLAHQKANNVKEERKRRNYILCKNQNYHKLTDQQKINLDIEKNINLIKEIEEDLYNKANKAEIYNEN